MKMLSVDMWTQWVKAGQDELGDWDQHTYAAYVRVYITICKIDSQYEAAVQCRELSLVPCDDPEGWDVGMGGKEVQERGYICIHIANSLPCIAEANTTS